MTASDLTAEQMLNRAIAWLAAQSIVKDQATVAKLREHCLPTESDKQKALKWLETFGLPFLQLSPDQARLILSVVERCPDDYSQSTKPKLALGQRWRRRDGEVVTIDEFTLGSTRYPFKTRCSTGIEIYTSEGYCNASGAESPYDLVECLYSPSCEH